MRGTGIRSLKRILKEDTVSYKRQWEKSDKEFYLFVHPAWTVYFENKYPDGVQRKGKNRVLRTIDHRLEMMAGSISAGETAEHYMVAHNLVREYLLLRRFSKERNVAGILLANKLWSRLRFEVKIAERRVDRQRVYVSDFKRYMRDALTAEKSPARSLFSLESSSWFYGYINRKNMELLEDFLAILGVEKVKLCGNYINGCLDSCMESFRRISHIKAEYKPEMCFLHEADIGNFMRATKSDRGIFRHSKAFRAAAKDICKAGFGSFTAIGAYEGLFGRFPDINDACVRFQKDKVVTE
jgi:hypothetical protein